MTTKEKFLQLVSKEKTNTFESIKERQERRKFIKMSQLIAFDILARLDELGWTQKRLAEEMNVTPQLVNKWIKGNENFTLETLVNLETALGKPLVVRPGKVEKTTSNLPRGKKKL
ncbi:helix-turn-helix transcriptional regulator [Flavihumibacter solisilvae]|uniref:HTH cro/C1-type domain-containing protein n=1 Tax=Flavihumibacter solisilvae TaxID=1349421 RepID=A0A0C1INY5_9BACT|nr:helix-turn-helix transcriptional regulator [Flavihumibacter solisilvae]KIC95930.1 hypothetical protein OI18_03340 [Flavihumibacter solisilvae]